MGWKRFFKAAIYFRGVERFVRHILQLVDFYRSNTAESSIRRHFKIGIIQIELAIQRFRRFSFQINFSSTKYCEISYASQTVFESHTKCDFIVMRQFWRFANSERDFRSIFVSKRTVFFGELQVSLVLLLFSLVIRFLGRQGTVQNHLYVIPMHPVPCRWRLWRENVRLYWPAITEGTKKWYI